MFVRVSPKLAISDLLRKMKGRVLVFSGATAVSGNSQALLVLPLLGGNPQRGYPLPGRELRSNVPKGTEGIVLQYLEQHIADPIGANR